MRHRWQRAACLQEWGLHIDCCQQCGDEGSTIYTDWCQQCGDEGSQKRLSPAELHAAHQHKHYEHTHPHAGHQMNHTGSRTEHRLTQRTPARAQNTGSRTEHRLAHRTLAHTQNNGSRTEHRLMHRTPARAQNTGSCTELPSWNTCPPMHARAHTFLYTHTHTHLWEGPLSTGSPGSQGLAGGPQQRAGRDAPQECR